MFDVAKNIHHTPLKCRKHKTNILDTMISATFLEYDSRLIHIYFIKKNSKKVLAMK